MLSRSRPELILGLALGLALVAPLARAQVPGRDAFARDPKTPLETWEVANYLIRIGQPDQAAPYVKKFLDGNPDDAAMLDVRDAYGVGSILSLSDNPETRPYAKAMADRLALASSRSATDPARLDRAVEGLTRSKAEQAAAVERLREAGSYAVAPIVRALGVAGLDASSRTPLADNLSRLDRNAVPALIATLDSPDAKLVGDVARALGKIGDPRAIPSLTYVAAKAGFAGSMARVALRELTGREFDSQPRSPVRLLTTVARNYHDHLVRFPGDPIVLWAWDASAKEPVPVTLPVRDAEGLLGLRAAREALELDPNDVEAKVVQLGLGLDHDPDAWHDLALQAGPTLLGQVLRRAVLEKRNDLAIALTPILAGVVNRNDLQVEDRPNALVDALISPDRRTQMAAADTLVQLDPRSEFPGSSRLVPVLSRFVSAQPTPRALVVDGNAERSNQVSGFLRGLGYDARTTSTGSEAFTEAADSADLELITVDPNFINDTWKLPDFLGNLKADPRTSNIPVFIVGPLDVHDQLASRLESFPDVQFLVTPSETSLLKSQLDRGFRRLGVRPLTTADRADLAKKSSSLLAQVARSAGSPFEPDLAAAEPALTLALNGPTAGLEAAAALGDVPGTDSQRSLADVALDPSKPAPLRLETARQLARNIRRFGPKLDPAQERRLVDELNQEADPSLKQALAGVVGSLKPGPDASASLPGAGRPASP